MTIDPAGLVTSEAELAEVFAEFAERRTAFSMERADDARLDAVLSSVRSAPPAGDWSQTGVDAEAISALLADGVSVEDLHRVFVHPDAVDQWPRVLSYYQRLVSMSDKVFGRLFPVLNRLKSHDSAPLSQEAIREIQALNRILSHPSLSTALMANPERFVLFSEGAAIDGAWRNAVGRIATWKAFEAIIDTLEPGEIDAATLRKTGSASQDALLLNRSSRESLVAAGWGPEGLTVGDHVLKFGAQSVGGKSAKADITVAKCIGGVPSVIVAAGEIKGSTDPANAMERWRLASGNVIAMDRMRTSPAQRRPTTFYIGVVITTQVVEGADRIVGLRAMLTDNRLDAAFSLIKLVDPVERARFRAFFRPQVGL